jgi:hypothetical protein
MASPSGSRTIGQATISTGKFRSRTMRRITASCAASFCPKYAASGSINMKQLGDDRGHTAKMPGRERPSSFSLSPSTTTQVTRRWSRDTSLRPAARTESRRPLFPATGNRAQTGADISTNLPPAQIEWGLQRWKRRPHRTALRAARTSDKCPSCRAPIVGTSPSRL